MAKIFYEQTEFDFFPESVIEAKETKRVNGGVYIAKGLSIDDPEAEWNFLWGKGLMLLYDGINDIFSDIEIGGLHNYQLVDGYSFGINKIEKTWHIRDTGFKGCKHYLKKGKYINGFEESLQPIFKAIHKW